jgi:N-acyl-D-amino-acid deacylase
MKSLFSNTADFLNLEQLNFRGYLMSKINRRNFVKATGLFGLAAMINQPVPRFFSSSGGFDLVILNGNLIDGSGKKEFAGDIGIKDGVIKEIGKLKDAGAALKIDASGLKVTPGFIDIHSHTDTDLLINPKAESKIRQGVTTEIAGQDGSSWAPVGGPEVDRLLKNFKETYGDDLSWRNFDEFLDYFSARKFCVNFASMVGQGTLRENIVGMDDRPATSDEIQRMQKEIVKAIEQGAVGISSGLEYTPGSFASTEELIKLCSAAPEKGRLYSTHMRNEDNYVIEAVKEAIRIAEESDSRLLLAHLKVSGKSNWGKGAEVLELIDKAAANGLEIHADRYTYVAYHTNLSALFPLWARDGGTAAFIDRLSNESDKMKEFVEKKISNLDGDWNGVLISSIGNKELKEYQGLTIQQISEKIELSPFETTVKILIDTNNSVMMMGFGMEEKSTEQILAHPLVMIASDAGSHAPYPPMNRSIAHPRAYGTFPRAIAHYTRDRKICTLEEMIRKMTSMPAEKLRLKDRGLLQKGKNADLVLFDYNTIKDKASFTEPHQYPEGIPYVIVNGQVVIDKGEHTGAMPGVVIK